MIRKVLFKPLNAGKVMKKKIEEENLQHCNVNTDIKILLSQYKRLFGEQIHMSKFKMKNYKVKFLRAHLFLLYDQA